MVTLKITKQGLVNRKHGHAWDVMVGTITKALNRHKNPFNNSGKDNKPKKETETKT